MINLISEKTACDIRVGQNGVVVINGAPEGVLRATKAVKMVEDEAHAADLATRVEAYLGGSASG